jgi:hypothetical protein
MDATGAVATRRAPGGATNAVSIRAASAAARCGRVPAAGVAGPVDAATVAALPVLAREAPGEPPGAVAEAQPATVSADAETQPARTIARPASRRRLIRWMSHMPVRRRTRPPGSAGRLRRQRPFQHRPGHLGQQPVRAEQLRALGPGPAQQLVGQLVIDQRPAGRLPAFWFAAHLRGV